MNKHFNLLDEPWVPVRFHSGEVRELGLREVFAQAGSIATLAETSPPNLIALYRLLLAITHRALLRSKGSWKDRDRAEWYRNGLPVDAIHDYLEQWRERFWLFHPESPFMQVAALAGHEETRDKMKSWTQIALDSANGNSPVLFDHSVDMSPTPIAPVQAIRNLLGFLQFTPGGLVKVIRSADKAGSIANSAAIVPLGMTLNQTLCLAVHPCKQSIQDDRPAWESDQPSVSKLGSEPCLATGPNDRYTRLTRAVLFIAESETNNIRHLRFAAGLALADDPSAPDPMVSYRIGTNGPVRISFNEGRAIWRDLSSLLPDPSGKYAIPAAVLTWSAYLMDALEETDSQVPILIAGLASDQAKLLRWRSERFDLPASLLIDPDAGPELRQQLRAAEDTYYRLRGFASDLVAETLPDPSSKDTRARARSILNAGPCAASYFTAVERSLPSLMLQISRGEIDEADAMWRATLATAAISGWRTTCRSLGQSAAVLRAEAVSHWKLSHLLQELRGDGAVVPKTEQNSRSTSAEEAHP